MSHGIKQRRFQLFALPERFRVAHALDSIMQLFIETFIYAASGFRFLGPALGSCRKLPGSNSGGKERGKRHPVLWVVNGECVKGWEKEEIETEHCQHRGQKRRATSPVGRG